MGFQSVHGLDPDRPEVPPRHRQLDLVGVQLLALPGGVHAHHDGSLRQPEGIPVDGQDHPVGASPQIRDEKQGSVPAGISAHANVGVG